jgi:hypothetical protein
VVSPAFFVSAVADQAITGRNADIADSLPNELPHLDHGRTIQVDAIVFDRRIGSVRGNEIKRANGDSQESGPPEENWRPARPFATDLQTNSGDGQPQSRRPTDQEPA